MYIMRLFILPFILFWAVVGCSQPASLQHRVLNAKDHHVRGDGKTDDTKAIQDLISKGMVGDTIFFPEGEYLVRTIRLRSGIHLKAKGTLIQPVSLDTQAFSQKQRNSSAPLFRADRVTNVYISARVKSVNEAIFISNSADIKIHRSTFDGNQQKLHAFPGVLIYASKNILIDESTVTGYGIPRKDPKRYQSGTAVRLLSSSDVKITNSELFRNGENGVFMHACSDVAIEGNKICYNGMSGVQIAFGSSKREKNFRITDNEFSHNAADAVDINNRVLEGVSDINCLISGNSAEQNGYVNGQSTPDGSGIATLIGVSGVILKANRSAKNNRPAIYIENCGELIMEGNITDSKVELVEAFKRLTFIENRFDVLTCLNNVRGGKLIMRRNNFRTLLLPNGITIDSLVLINNLLYRADININLTGNVHFEGNHLLSNVKSGAVLLVKESSALFKGNYVLNTEAPAFLISKSANRVHIAGNLIQGKETVITDFGSPDLRIEGNMLRVIEGGGNERTLVSYSPDNLRLIKNIHEGGKRDNSVRLYGEGKAFIKNEKTVSGHPDYGDVLVLED